MNKTDKMANEMPEIPKVEKKNTIVKTETPRIAMEVVKESPQLPSDRIYLAAASHLKSEVLTAMRTVSLSNNKVFLAHMDYILEEPFTEVFECIL